MADSSAAPLQWARLEVEGRKQGETQFLLLAGRQQERQFAAHPNLRA